MSGRRRRDELAWTVVGETCGCNLLGLRIDIHPWGRIRGTVKIVFLPLLPYHQKNSTIADAVFIHVPRYFVRSLRSSNSIPASNSGLRRVRSWVSSHSAWIRVSAVRSHCESTQTRREFRGNDIIRYMMATL